MSARPRPVGALVVLAGGLLAGLFAMTDLPLGVFHDDAHYAILARELAAGHGFAYANLPGAPRAVHFPPGFPALLAPIWWLWPAYPANVAALKAVNVVLLAGVALLTRLLARQGGLGPIAAVGVALAAVWTVPMLFLAGLLFSEVAFTVAVLGALWLAGAALRRTAATGAGAAHADGLWLGAALAAAVLVRTAGVAVVAGCLLALAWHRRWRVLAVALVPVLAALGGWQRWVSAHGAETPTAVAGMYGTYGAWVADALAERGAGFVGAVARHNLPGFGIVLTLAGLDDASTLLRLAVTAALVAALLLGMRRAWHDVPALACTVPPYLALVLVWPGPPDRFLWPLWPVLLVLLSLGVREAWRWIPDDDGGRGARWLLLGGASATAVAMVAWHVRTWPSRSWEGGARGNVAAMRAAAAVVATLPPDARIAADFDAHAHLATGRTVSPLSTLTALEHLEPRAAPGFGRQLAAVLDAYHPTHLVVAQRSSAAGAEWLRRRTPPRVRLVTGWPQGVLLYAPTP